MFLVSHPLHKLRTQSGPTGSFSSSFLLDELPPHMGKCCHFWCVFWRSRAQQQVKDDGLCLQRASEDTNLLFGARQLRVQLQLCPHVLSLLAQMMRCVQTKPSLISSWSAPLLGCPLQPPFHYLSHGLVPDTNIDIITDLSSCLNLEANCPPHPPPSSPLFTHNVTIF